MIRSSSVSRTSSWLESGSSAGTQRSSPNQTSTPPQSPSSAAASSYALRGVEPPASTIEPPASTASARSPATAAAAAPASGRTTSSTSRTPPTPAASPTARPPTECGQQPGLHLVREILLPDAADDRNRHAHLVEVVRATVALAQVGVEARALGLAQPTLEIARHELDDLRARQAGFAAAAD